ncbi:MAG: WXG100 family type VII secretion target [Cumulibacter sp.]
MSTTGTSIGHSDPAEYAKQASDAGERIKNMLAALMNGLEPLQSTWKGAGGTSFISAKAQVEAATNKLHYALTTLGEDMSQAGVQYNQADEQGQQAIQKSEAEFANLGNV